jgi:hypothetical protein
MSDDPRNPGGTAFARISQSCLPGTPRVDDSQSSSFSRAASSPSSSTPTYVTTEYDDRADDNNDEIYTLEQIRALLGTARGSERDELVAKHVAHNQQIINDQRDGEQQPLTAQQRLRNEMRGLHVEHDDLIQRHLAANAVVDELGVRYGVMKTDRFKSDGRRSRAKKQTAAAAAAAKVTKTCA